MQVSIEDAAALAADIEAAFASGGEERLFALTMPNGQPFGACSGAQLREISEAFNKVARRGALTAAGLAARSFIDGVYVEMASVELGTLALSEAGHDEDKARAILRRLLAADATVLRHLLDRVIEDEVRATITGLKARADAKLPPGYEAEQPAEPARAASPARDEALLMRVRAVLQEEAPTADVPSETCIEEETSEAEVHVPGAQAEEPMLRAVSHYALAARSALAQIYGNAASW